MNLEFEQVLNRRIPGRADFFEQLKELYPAEDVHGLNHALEVERRAIKVLGIACREAKARGEKIKVNLPVLILAALGHDVGYIVEEKLSPDKFEHSEEGARIVEELLRKNFFLSPKEKAGISSLIEFHDDKPFSYPLRTRGGKPCLTEDELEQREKETAGLGFLTELRILREADSFFVTGKVGFERTTTFSGRKGLPWFADGELLRVDMWEVSIVSNLRLSARRAFEDAFTRRGKMMALVGWAVQELEIYRRCQIADIEYVLDPILLEKIKRFL